MMNAVTWDFPPEKVQCDGGWKLITTVKWLVAISVGHLLYSYNAERERAQLLRFIDPLVLLMWWSKMTKCDNVFRTN